MGGNPYTFPVCSSYKTSTNTSKVVLLSKSWDNLETEASSALQEVGRHKQEVNWGNWLFRERRCTGQSWGVSLSGAHCGVTEEPMNPLWPGTATSWGFETDRTSPQWANSNQSRTWHLHSNIFKHEWQLSAEKWGDLFGFRWGDAGKTQRRFV